MIDKKKCCPDWNFWSKVDWRFKAIQTESWRNQTWNGVRNLFSNTKERLHGKPLSREREKETPNVEISGPQDVKKRVINESEKNEWKIFNGTVSRKTNTTNKGTDTKYTLFMDSVSCCGIPGHVPRWPQHIDSQYPSHDWEQLWPVRHCCVYVHWWPLANSGGGSPRPGERPERHHPLSSVRHPCTIWSLSHRPNPVNHKIHR